MAICSTCGNDFKNVPAHARLAHPSTAAGPAVAVAERPSQDGPRSQRARRAHSLAAPSIIDQIPVIPGTEPGSQMTGAWAYYLRPEGETIAEILIVQPNGGIPNIEPRMQARFGTNASYYRERYAAKGIEYLGTVLNEEVMRRVVETLVKNREEGINFCLDEIDECIDVIKNSDLPEVRNQHKRRREAFELRLAVLQQDLDINKVLGELNDIARAYQLQKLDPNLLAVLKSMIGEQDDRFSKRMQDYVAHFQRGAGDIGLERAKAVLGGNDRGESFKGADFIDND